VTRKFFIATALALLAACGWANHAAAAPDKAQYELQERCGKRAAEIFRQEFGDEDTSISNTETGESITTYNNHYSATLNKCFFLEIVTNISYKSTPEDTSTMMTLFDLNDHKEYGDYFKSSLDSNPATCNVKNAVCHSESEWRELLKPYMEN
jgi:hypothetical protein